MNYDQDERSFNSLKSHKSGHQSEEEEQNYGYGSKANDEQPATINKYMKLPKFDVSEFKNLNLSAEFKDLMTIMNK